MKPHLVQNFVEFDGIRHTKEHLSFSKSRILVPKRQHQHIHQIKQMLHNKLSLTKKVRKQENQLELHIEELLQITGLRR